MITALYTSILGILYFRLSLKTISARRKHQVSLGVGESKEIESVVSAHANFNAYVPLLMLLLYFSEVSNQFHMAVIHMIGALVVIGRYLHMKAFVGEKMVFKHRRLGMHLTLWPLLILSGMGLFIFVRSHL